MTYTKGRIISPFVTLEYGHKVFDVKNDHTAAVFRGLGSDFLAVKPGVNIRISKNIHLALALNYSAQNPFSGRPHWTRGLPNRVESELRKEELKSVHAVNARVTNEGDARFVGILPSHT